MAFTGITATEAEIDQLAGANVPTTYTDTMKTQALLWAESNTNNFTRYNWTDWYATTPNVDVKYTVTQTNAAQVAIEAINYDKEAIGRSIAESRINVLRDIILRNLQFLRDIKKQTFILEA